MGCHSPLQGIFLAQGSNPGFLNYRWILYHLSHQESLTCAYWHLQFTRFGGQLVTVALRKSPRENIAEINYRHNPLSKSEPQQVYFPHNHEGEKKKKNHAFTGQDVQHPELLQEECQSKQLHEIKLHQSEGPSSQVYNSKWGRGSNREGNPPQHTQLVGRDTGNSY